MQLKDCSVTLNDKVVLPRIHSNLETSDQRQLFKTNIHVGGKGLGQVRLK